ncbi:hypothetical protein Tco_1067444 [Tanacetum coccineum]|uniref:Reverse transcriptase n=1 Tax=Tanacetum coccineum TaxID=301880 RepID=A0ABQ5HCZ3_9ASTR
MLHGLVINWSSYAIETARNRVNGELHENMGKRVARTTARIALEFAPDYAFSVSLLLTPLCCDDIHDVTPRVSALAGSYRSRVVAIDGSEANRIMRDSKFVRKGTKEDARSRRSTKAYQSNLSDTLVVCYFSGSRSVSQDLVGFTPCRRIGFRMELVQGVDADLRSLLSGAKRKLSRCGRNQLGNEPILALPEGADDFVVYYDARSKDLEACLEKKGEGDCLYVATTEEGLNMRQSRWMKLFSEYGFEAKYHLGKANVVVESWSRRKSEAKNEFWIDYQGSAGLLLQPELPEYKWGRITKDIVVKLPSVSTGYDAIRV